MINVRITSARLNNLCYSLGEGKTTARRTFLVWSYWCDPLALFLPPNSPVQSDPYQFDSSASIPQAQSMDLTLHSFKSGPALLKKKQSHQALDMFFFIKRNITITICSNRGISKGNVNFLSHVK